jgi:hypothetical protein
MLAVVSITRLEERVSCVQLGQRSLVVVEVDPRGEVLRPVEHPDVRLGAAANNLLHEHGRLSDFSH